MKIRELREKAGLTTAEIASAMGLCVSTVYKWENGPNQPTADNLLKLAELLHCTIDEIFGREPPAKR